MFIRGVSQINDLFLRSGTTEGSADGGADDSAAGNGADETSVSDAAAGGEGGDENAGSDTTLADGSASEGDGKKVAPAAKPQSAGKPDWRDQRIARLTAQLRDAQAKPADPGATTTQTQTLTIPQTEIDRLANEKAAQIAAATDFNRRCQDVVLAGESAFGQAEFRARVGNLIAVRGETPAERQAYNQFLEAAMETGEAPRLLFELGADQNEAGRILSLSPAKMAVELTKLALKPAISGATGSKAAKPITPVGSPGGTRDNISAGDKDRADTLTTAQWMARREAELKQKEAA